MSSNTKSGNTQSALASRRSGFCFGVNLSIAIGFQARKVVRNRAPL
jgi:hypothetical protein